MQERRKRIRFVQRNEVLIRTALNRYQGTGIKGFTYDLSTGGARIRACKPYPAGSMLRLKIDLAGTDESVIVDGVVTWLKMRQKEPPFEFGVAFRNLTSRAILILIRHLYRDGAKAVQPAA